MGLIKEALLLSRYKYFVGMMRSNIDPTMYTFNVSLQIMKPVNYITIDFNIENQQKGK